MAFSSQFKRPESTIFQSSYLQTIQNKGHTTTANLHSKLAIWTLVWMVKNGTPKSSSICLLPCHQGALVARWKHLECYIWSLPTWLQAANPVCGKCSPSWDGWAICTAGLHSWWRDHFSFSGEDTTLPEFRKIYFWLDRYEAQKSGGYLESQLITRCLDPLNWKPRSCLVVIWGITFPHLRMHSLCSSRNWWWNSILSTTALVCCGRLTGSWQAASAWGTWLWRFCRPRSG